MIRFLLEICKGLAAKTAIQKLFQEFSLKDGQCNQHLKGFRDEKESLLPVQTIELLCGSNSISEPGAHSATMCTSQITPTTFFFPAPSLPQIFI